MRPQGTERVPAHLLGTTHASASAGQFRSISKSSRELHLYCLVLASYDVLFPAFIFPMTPLSAAFHIPVCTVPTKLNGWNVRKTLSVDKGTANIFEILVHESCLLDRGNTPAFNYCSYLCSSQMCQRHIVGVQQRFIKYN